MENKLEGRVALVTGASRGIGRAVALRLANLGAKVVVNYSGSTEKAEVVRDEIISVGGTAITYKANVADFKQCEEMIKEVVNQFGRIDILVNNAGITRDGLLMKMSEEDFDAVIDTNLKGTFNTIRFASRYMSKNKFGRIINMSSIAGLVGNRGQVNYSASKAGVIGITKTVAKELARKNVTCNAIAPGFIETDMTEVLSEEVKANIKREVPLGRTGSPEDIAKAVGFFCTDGDYITGQVLTVDGGMTV